MATTSDGETGVIDIDPSLAGLVSRLAQLERDAVHERLRHRDHVIGLQAELVTAQNERAAAEQRSSQLAAEVRRLRGAVKDARRAASAARAELRALRSSRTWRVGRLVLAPLRLGRR
ncbi:hypothetical protein QT381_08030 [Galbitalea sp. SE-J8]|uniref:hypothetical protein n=1 Tax=Galbitalea sp. SE-J8 TaxID=3054952 RepID=UPI00259D2B52|nr:hypothetical protein [Galbitalea sp. SE-J8]MDM4762953.1 hypothetical protein [Galbitalea sp. SE-J8]